MEKRHVRPSALWCIAWRRWSKRTREQRASTNTPCPSLFLCRPQITDALRHMPYCVQYMEQLRDTMVFRFCAIPQIMAAGTLALCYNNGKVFEGARR